MKNPFRRRGLRRVWPLAAVVVAVVGTQQGAAGQQYDDAIAAARQTPLDEIAVQRGARFVDESGASALAVRCATRTMSDVERQLNEAYVRAQLADSAFAARTGDVVVPVYFHILRKSNGAFDVTNEQIDAQLEVLNAAFVGEGFRFELAGVRRYNKNRYAKRCLSRSVELQFKNKYAVDPATTLNVYTCLPSQNVLGYAWFPDDWPEDDPMHGIVVRYSTLPGGGAVPYDEGDTVVHEVGHYLGLFHTFEGGCSGRGDRVGDTAREGKATFGCPVGKDSCPGSPGLDPIDNFMDYTDDACMLRFTDGQESRMQKQTRVFRPSLGS